MALVLISLALTVGVLAACYVTWWNSRMRKTIDNIPGPRALPLIGNGLQLKDGHEGTVQLNELCREYGGRRGVMRLWMGPKPCVLLSRAQAVEVLFSNSCHLKKSYMYRFLHPWLSFGLLTSDREKWRVRRRILTPTFHFKILNDFFQVFNEQARILVKLMDDMCGKSEPFNIYPYLTRCTLDVICETAMGKNFGTQVNKDSDYLKAVHGVSLIIQTRVKTPLWQSDFIFYRTKEGKEHQKYLKTLHEFTRKVIEERSAELDQHLASHTGKVSMEDLQTDKPFLIGKQKCLALLDMLLIAAKGGADLSHADIQEEVDTFMFEGHDTTASGTGWALYCLGRHPGVQSRVQEELDQIFGESERDVTSEDVAGMRYLDCVVKEGLRLYPPVPMFGRELEQDTVIAGYPVLKGTTAMVITPALHLDPEYFPDPERFDPDRWLPENSAGRHAYCHVPFSAGNRNCIGQKFALSEEKVLLSVFLRRFTVQAHQDESAVRPSGQIILKPENGLLLTLTPRHHTERPGLSSRDYMVTRQTGPSSRTIA